MAIRHEFPYANLHDLNIDWILKIVREFQHNYNSINEELDNAIQTLDNEKDRLIDEMDEYFPQGIEQAVSDWLEAHPEATTTVPDYSLTIYKIAIGALGYIMPEMFGAVGDGVTNDYQAICDAVNFSVQYSSMLGQYSNGAIPIKLTKKYLFDGAPIDISNKVGINIISEARYQSVVICPSGFMTCVNSGQSAQGVRDLTIEGVTFICNNSNIILQLHKPRNTVLRNCVFRGETYSNNNCTAIETCATMNFTIEGCQFYYCNTGVSIISDNAIPQATTFKIVNCRFTTNVYGIRANLNNTTTFIKSLNVIDTIFEAGTAGIRIVCGSNSSHVNVSGSHFEYLTEASILISGGTLVYDETNFMYISPNESAGITLYNSNIVSNLYGNGNNYIVVDDNRCITDISGITINPLVNSVIKAGNWMLDTYNKIYKRTVLSLNVTTLTPTITFAKIDFRNDTSYWSGYFAKSDNVWTLTKIAGNIEMINDTTGGIQAPSAGTFTINY